MLSLGTNVCGVRSNAQQSKRMDPRLGDRIPRPHKLQSLSLLLEGALMQEVTVTSKSQPPHDDEEQRRQSPECEPNNGGPMRWRCLALAPSARIEL